MSDRSIAPSQLANPENGYGAGLLSGVESAIAALPSPDREAAEITWQHATGVRRDDPLLQQLATALSLDAAALDGLFMSAAEL